MMNSRSTYRSLPLLLLIFALFLTACGQDEPAPPASSDTLKIEVDHDAIYRLPLSDLQKAGLAIDELSYDTLSLTSEETVVPYHIADESLIFYGQMPTDRYQAVHPYLLHSGASGMAMDETAVSNKAIPTDQVAVNLHLEENLEYKGEYRNDENADDLWYWQEIGVEQAVPINFELPTVADGSGTLHINWQGITHNPSVENDHDITLILNGQTLDTIRWDGETAFTSETAVPANTLKNGENTLILDNSGEGATLIDITALNWIDLVYAAPPTAVSNHLAFSNTNGSITLTGFDDTPMLFDNQNPIAPQLLTGGEDGFDVTNEMAITAVSDDGYATPSAMTPLRESDWQKSNNAADLLIITTDALVPALAPLAEARQAEGLAVAIAPVAEIYDAFGEGAHTPIAIQQFIAHAVETWDTPPRYILLVGDATVDFRNYLAIAPDNIVPSPMIPVGYSGETVSDARLADTDGDGSPDVAIGRWPVSDEAMVEELIERTLAYENGTASARALFFTDGTESQFASIGENLATGSGLTDAEHFDGVEAEELTAVYNDGSWLTTYIGHGSIERWGKEDIFYPEAVEGLNSYPSPIVLQMTCLSGLFAHHTITSLSETMLLHDSGPIALVGATSLTLSSSQEPFGEAFVAALQEGENGRLGDAFQQAKAGLDISNGGIAEVSDTFNLLGDPSARIVRPE